MITGKAKIECPFCQKIGVIAFHKPSYLQAKTTRISAGAKVVYRRIPETYFIQSDCPNCGRKKKEIQKAFDGEISTKRMSHEGRLKRLKEAGFPMEIEG